MQFGTRLDRVNGVLRYVTRDAKFRALVGPVSHRQGSRLVTEADKEPAASGAAQAFRHFQEWANDVTARRTPTPPPRRNWFKRAVEAVQGWCVDRFYDEEWHKAVRRTALDIMLGAATIGVVVLVGRLIALIVVGA